MKTRPNESLTQYEIIELMKCSNDPMYFIETYIANFWSDRHGQYSLFPCQKEMINNYDSYNYNILLLSRNTGFTTATAAYVLWKILFESYQRVAIFGPSYNFAADILDKIGMFHFALPKFLQLTGKFNKRYVELDNGSCIFIGSFNNFKSTKSQSLSMAVFDTMSFGSQQSITDCYMSIRQQLIPSGKLIIGSIPDRSDDFFGKLWAVSTNNGVGNISSNGFKSLRITWKDGPVSSDTSFIEAMVKVIGPESFAKEYDCLFN